MKAKTTISKASFREWQEWFDPTRNRDSPSLGWSILFGDDGSPTWDLTMGLAVFTAGSSNGTHSHDPAEIYYLLSGKGVVEIEGKKIPVEPGDAVFIPGDTTHHILNPGPEPLTVLWVLAADRFSETEYRYELPDKAAPVPVRHGWQRDRTAGTTIEGDPSCR